jgi:two-component system, NarL family, nitrate/nitrite response regulator NarL
MNNENEITVIIADDHELLCEGFRSVFEKAGIKVLAMANNGEELLQLVRQHRPQIVVTDIKMPVMDGIEVTAIIKKEFPQIKVLVLTNYDEVWLIKDMKEAGAEGFALKNARKEELLSGIHALKEGRDFYCSHTAKKLLTLQVKPLPPTVTFTPREMDVMKLMMKGYSNKEVASELRINGRTVEFHRANLYAKTGARSPVQLALFAQRHGVV